MTTLFIIDLIGVHTVLVCWDKGAEPIFAAFWILYNVLIPMISENTVDFN